MDNGRPRTHHPWLAGVLSLLLPGAGQLYNRQFVRAPIYLLLAGVLWCAGLGWIVHLLAALDGWLAGGRIQEWGPDGRSVRTAARLAAEERPEPGTKTDGGGSLARSAAAASARRAQEGLRKLARSVPTDGYAGDDAMGAVVHLLQALLIYVEPITYAVLRQRQLRALRALAAPPQADE